MKLSRGNTFTKLVKIMLDIFFIGTICFLFLLPQVVEYFLGKDLILTPTISSTAFLIRLLAIDFVVMYVLYELRKIFKSISSSSPFTESNVKSLFRMGLASLLLALFYIIMFFIIKSLFSFVVILTLIVGGSFSIVLSEVFREALRVKNENDLTI